MKKVLLLFIMLTATTALNLSWAQLGVGQQMQNNDFEQWYTEYSSRQAPTGWHSLNSGTGTLVGFAREDFISQQTGNPGGNTDRSKVVRVTCKKVMGVAANGSLTSGRFNAGAMSASNASNCTYTSTVSGYNQTLTAYPDSVYLWVRTSVANNLNARVNIVIHTTGTASNNAIYQDPAPGSQGSNSTGGVVGTTWAVNEGKVVAKATWNNHTSTWTQLKLPFDYASYASNNATPAYILATLASNEGAGEGHVGDYLEFDDIVLIYNTRLATLTVDGTGIAGFNPDVTTYTYSTPICEGIIPTVAGECQSGHASTQITHTPTIDQPYTTIRVKHQSQESTVYKDYTINFTIVSAPAAPTVTAPDPDCSSSAHPVTLTASSAGATAYRWYTSATGVQGTEVATSSYDAQGTLISGSVTYYVSAVNSTGCESGRTPVTATVNINPAAPTPGSNTAVCYGSTGTFTVTPPDGDNLTCRWYATNNSSDILGTGTSLEVSNLTQSTTRYASTYNTVTGCESGRVAITVTVNNLPSTPTNLTGGSHCGAGTVILSATPANGTSCQWYATETGGNSLGSGDSFTTPSIASTTTYYVASYNSNTGCSSARAAVTATINPIPGNPSVNGNEAICAGESLTLTATPGSNSDAIRWYNSSEQQVSENASLNTGALTQSTSFTAKSYNSTSGCYSSGTNVNVVVNALPAAPALNGDSRCGSGDVTLSVSNPVDGTTYTWYNANDSELGTGSSYTAQNLSNTAVYHVIATANGCTGASATVTATINTLPEAPTTSNVELCEAGSATLNVSNPVSGYQYKWYSAATGGEAMHTGESYTVSVNESPSTYYVEAISTESCASTQRSAATVTISGNPSAPVVPDVSRCGNGNITINVSNPNSNYTYNWYASAEGGDAFHTGASYSLSNLQQDVTYYVSVSIGNCESDRTAVTAHVKTVPGAPDLSSNSRCGSGDITLAVNNPNNDYTYTWYNSNNQEVNTGNTYTIENLSSTSSYYVTATLDGCTGASATVTATINSIPELPSVSSGSHCGEGTVTLSATAGQGGNQVKWFAAAEGGEALETNDSYTTPSISESTTYYAASYNSTTQCISGRQSVLAVINAIPATAVAQNVTLCGPGFATLTAEPAENCSCQWFNSSYINITAGSSDETRTYSTANLTQNTTYYVRSYHPDTHCYSEYTNILVTIAAIPGNPTVSNKARCGAGEITLTATPGNNANTCRWYSENDEYLFEGNSYVINNLAETTNYKCKSYNTETGCESSARNVMATINPVPGVPTVNGNTPICGSGALQLTAVPGDNATICRWINGSETINSNSFSTGTISQSTDYAVQSYNANTQCASENVTVSVVVNSLPNAPQTTNDTQCLGTEVTLTSTAGEHTIVRWYASAQDNNILYEGNEYHPTNLTVGENTFYASSYDTLTQCASASRSVATATMIDAPAIPNVADTTHCGPAAFTLNIVNPQDNTTYKWYTVAQEGTATEGTSFTTGTLNSTTHYYVSATVSGYSCESGRKDVTVTINAVPANPSISGNNAICAGQTLTVSASSDDAATNFVWSDGQTSTEGEDFTTPTLSENASYTVKAYNASTQCESESVSFTVTVNPNPEAPQASSDTQCQNETLTLSATATNGNSCYWYASAESTEELATGNSYSPDNLSVGSTTFYVSQRNNSTYCESERVAVNAIVNPTYAVNYPIVACDSFRWNNETFTESGDYARTLHSQLGCDSVVTLQLTINKSKVTEFDTTVCDIFVWNNQSYETSGDYEQTFRTSQDCDSTVHVHLTIKKSTVGSDHIYLCSNELPYDYNGIQNITAAGNYTLHTTNAAGCDSTINLTVTVNTQPSAAINLTPAARCGEGIVTLTAHAGQNGNDCRWYASENDDEALYTGTSYTTGSLTTTTTYYVSSYNDYNGHPCESSRQAITATINSNPAVPVVADQVRCGNGEVVLTASVDENANTCRWYQTLNTTTISATGLSYTPTISTNNANGITYYVESFNTNTNCKSDKIAVKATAYVIPSAPVLSALSNCGPHQFSINAPTNGYYKWYDSNESSSALDIQNNTTPLVDASRSYFISHAVDYTGISCESGKTELALTIYPVYAPQDLYDTLCQGDTYTEHGLNETFNTAGSADRTLATTSTHGCDSVVTLHLWVKENRSYSFDTTVCDSYVWNNETFTESEDITRNLTSSIGCDSVVTVHLTVNKSVQTEFTATDCDEYIWNNETYTTSGDYVQHFFTVNNCDSMVTLHLTINNSTETSFNEVACDSYQWNDSTYTTSGDYMQVFNTSKGCDSTVTLHLTVNYSTSATLTDAVCAGINYNANGFDTTFNTAGTYTLVRHDLNQANCDSTTTLTLTVNPIYHKDVTMTICETALPYSWNDITYEVGTESGYYEHTFSTNSISNCDSIVTLHLTISNQYETPIAEHICAGETFTFGNRSLTQSGIYYDTLQAGNLCDSIIVLTLTVHELHTTTLEDNICLGENYTEYGFDVTPDSVGVSTYQKTVSTEFGCDSTIILNLTVKPVYNFTEYDTVCATELPYTWQGREIEQAGTYTAEYQSSNSCDSIYHLVLTVNPTYFFPVTAFTCDNEEYLWEGHNVQIGQRAVGTYIIYDSLTTISGCDSVYMLTLTITPTYHFEPETATVCDNEEYVWEGHNVQIGQRTAGTYTIYDSLTTATFGCDSIHTLVLTVTPSYHFEAETATICDNEEYVWEGHNVQIGQRTAGTYTIYDSLTTATFGCDSIYTLVLTVAPSYHFDTETATVCDNEEYVWEGHNMQIGQRAAGIYTIYDSLSTSFGCDSIYTLILTVNEVKYTDIYESICSGEFFEYDNEIYEDAGNYDISFQTALGCDSIVTLHLTVNPVYNIDTLITICQGQLPYSCVDTLFDLGTISGNYVFHKSTAHGCDSTITLHLTVTPNATASQTVTICDNELPYTFLDSTFSTAGTYDVTETFADGCKRITTVTLIVNPTYDTTIYVTECGSYTLDRGTYQRVLTESGIYVDTLSSVSGCDSIVRLDLTINPLKDTLLTATICQGESYEENGFNLNPENAGIVYDTLHLQCVGTGCDSTVYMELTVAPSYDFEPETATVCDNDEYVWEGHDVQIGQLSVGVYTFTDSLTTANFGCDSIHTLILTVTPTYNLEAETDTICDSEVYVWEGHNVQIGQRAAGIYTIYDSLTTSIYGCDSIHTLILTVTPTYSFNDETATVCDHEEYVWAGHEHIQIGQRMAGIYTIYDSLTTTAFGCDSVYTLILIVTPSYHFDPETALVCDNEEYVWEGHEHIQIGQLDAGTYTFTDSLTTAIYGCDSVHTLTLTVTPSYNFETETDTICDNEVYVWEGHEHIQIGQLNAGVYRFTDSLTTVTYGCDSVYTLILTVNHAVTEDHTLTLCQSELPYTWRDINFGTETTVGSHQFTYNLETVQGCDSTVNLTLIINPNNEYYDNPVVFCEGGSYEWNGQTITESGLYTDTVPNDYGCYDVNKLMVTVNPVYHYTEYDTVCNNELPIVWRGIQIDHEGTFTATYYTTKGCDSTYTLVLTVNPNYYFPVTATTCDNEEYVWEDHNVQIGQRTAGTYTIWDSLKTVNGCDSVYQLTLTVTPTYHFEAETAFVCDNEEYVWEGHDVQIGQRVAGTYTIYDSLTTATFGCDSIHTLLLTVTPAYHFEVENAAVCDNEEYVWEGHNVQIGQRAAGTYTIYDSLSTSTYGCDSIHTLVLTVTPSYHFATETATVCDNEEYVWEGHNVQIGQLAAGTYTIYDSLTTTSYGCDSIYTLVLTVTPSYHFATETATVCDNEEYVWEGHNVQIGQRAAGIYTIYDSLTTTGFGCDSIYTLTLTVTPSYHFNVETATVCDNEEYVWEGHNVQIGQRTAGTYTIYDSLTTNIFGCDSIYTLILTVNPTAHSVESASSCSNEEILIWHGQALTATGIYYDTLVTTLQCDSVCELHFTMLEPTSAVFTDTTCANALYQEYGFEVTPTLSGDTILVRLTENVAGCDSTITVNLHVKTIATFSFDTIVCGAFNWNNQWYTESGSYLQNFTAANGCDSIVTVNLTIDTPARDTIEVAACESYEWDGTTYTQSGIYSKTYPQAVGCDSISVMILTINHSTEVTLYDTTCQAHRYQEYGFDTLTLQAGTFNLMRIDTNAAGCDSIINLVLTVHSGYLFVDSAITCANDNFVWQGMHCDTTGIYVKSYPTIHGCDSAYVLFLTVNPIYEVEVTDTTIAGTPYHNHGLNFTPQNPGTLNIDVPRTTVDGCDSIVHVILEVITGDGINLHYLDKHITLFPNPTDNVFTVSSTIDIINELTIFDNNGKAVWQQQVNDYDARVNVETLAPGLYFVRLRLPDNIVTKKLIVR